MLFEEVLSQILEIQTRSQLSSDLLEDGLSTEPIERDMTTDGPTSAKTSGTIQTMAANNDPLEKTCPSEQSTPVSPATPIFPERAEIAQTDDERSQPVSESSIRGDTITVNSVVMIDNQDSNWVHLDLPDSLLTAEDALTSV